MKASASAIALIAKFEGFRSRPYKIGNDPWTIGYGETSGVGPGTGPWSESYARQRLNARVNRDFAPAVERFRAKHGLKWNQNQFDAMVSVAYNLGAGMFRDGAQVGQTLRDALRRSHGVRQALMLYTMPGSQFEAGLRRRREAEADLFERRAVLSKAERWRNELHDRRVQLASEKRDGARKFLMRRIDELKTALRRERSKK